MVVLLKMNVCELLMQNIEIDKGIYLVRNLLKILEQVMYLLIT